MMTQFNEINFASALSQFNGAVVLTNLKGKILYVNDRFTDMTGYTSEDALGQTPSVLQSSKTPPGTHDHMWKALQAGKVWEGRMCNKRKPAQTQDDNPCTDDEFWVYLTISPIRNDQGEVYMYLATHQDPAPMIAMANQFDAEAKEVHPQVDADSELQEKDSLQNMLDEIKRLTAQVEQGIQKIPDAKVSSTT